MSNTRDSPLTGNEDEDYTLSAEELKARIQKRKNKLLETKEVEADAYTPKKSDTNADGDKKEYSVEDEYPIKEGKKGQ